MHSSLFSSPAFEIRDRYFYQVFFSLIELAEMRLPWSISRNINIRSSNVISHIFSDIQVQSQKSLISKFLPDRKLQVLCYLILSIIQKINYIK